MDFDKKWSKIWKKDPDKHNLNPTVAQSFPIDCKRPRIHANLTRAESSLGTQIRTEKIGFAGFLYRQRVPTVTSPACQCGWPNQTAKHVIMECRLNDIKEYLPKTGRIPDYQQLLSSPKWLKLITSQLMQTGFLRQYTVAIEQSYE